nr:hypothetical protein [uncultured Cupriavidus sp.]
MIKIALAVSCAISLPCRCGRYLVVFLLAAPALAIFVQVNLSRWYAAPLPVATAVAHAASARHGAMHPHGLHAAAGNRHRSQG